MDYLRSNICEGVRGEGNEVLIEEKGVDLEDVESIYLVCKIVLKIKFYLHL